VHQLEIKVLDDVGSLIYMILLQQREESSEIT